MRSTRLPRNPKGIHGFSQDPGKPRVPTGPKIPEIMNIDVFRFSRNEVEKLSIQGSFNLFHKFDLKMLKVIMVTLQAVHIQLDQLVLAALRVLLVVVVKSKDYLVHAAALLIVLLLRVWRLHGYASV